MTVLALGFDLFFKPRLMEAAKSVGVEVAFAAPKDALDKSATASRVVADVSAPGVMDAVEAIRAARPALPVLACYPHVAVDLAERAKRAGATCVTRGALNANLAAAVSGDLKA